jgi:hypothetical protein
MAGERSDRGCRSWLLWVLVSTVGLVVGVFVAIIVYVVVYMVAARAMGGDPRPWIGFIGIPVVGVVVGIVTGTVQWLVLRRRIAGASQWALMASAMGSAVGVPVGLFLVSIFTWPEVFFVG